MFAYKLKRQIQTLFIINENAIVFEVLQNISEHIYFLFANFQTIEA